MLKPVQLTGPSSAAMRTGASPLVISGGSRSGLNWYRMPPLMP